MTLDFRGYPRANGAVGIRNHVVILPAVGCANELAARIADAAAGVKPIFHNHSCSRLKPDNDMARRALIGLGSNPNAAAVLVVGAGCDTIPAGEIADAIAVTGKPVACVDIELDGNYATTLVKGIAIARDFVSRTAGLERQSCSVSHLTLGMKCTASDTTSVLACNPTVGQATDFIIKNGGRAIFTETTEMIGAEHILAGRARNPAVARKLCRKVEAMHRRIKQCHVDLLHSQPNEGNIKGGISTIEEKSLGGIGKAGTTPIQDVLDWAESPAGKGLFFMDSSANTQLVAIGLAAAGAQFMSLSFGGGVCARLRTATIHTAGGGLPVLPTIKTLSNPQSWDEAAWFDVYAGGILEGTETVQDTGTRLIQELLAVASGKPTKLETISGPYQEVWEFYTTGPWV
jgi:altronate dehydratase large subunit